MIPLPTEFSAFLKSLNDHDVRYLLISGFAVAYHGYPRATDDIDVWVARDRENAERLVRAIKAFGFDVPELSAALFLQKDRIVRMGYPPLRIELQTSISGVRFEACYRRKLEGQIGDLAVPLISLLDLKKNKRASGRHKDLADLENLP